jgi:hypothetical protein
VINDILLEQMNDDRNKLLQEVKDIDVVEISHLSYKQDKNYFFILDECDEMLQKHAVIFSGGKKDRTLYGLAAVAANCD